MKVIQGRYAEKIESGKGKLKGLRIETDGGSEVVYLPKELRAIAQTELTLDDPVRVWIEASKKSSKDKKRYALQLIPLTPKTRLESVSDRAITLTSDRKKSKEKSSGKKSKTKKKVKTKKAETKKARVRVQICQKKNCCKKGGDELWEAFETVNAERQFKLEPIGCLGGCKRGPNIRLLPDNVKYRHVQTDEVDRILQTHLA